jgi:3-oxo-5alpha-steroid 4-dehydrogenase
MLREHAPDHRGGLPLGTLGDDGSGIRLGVAAGAATGFLHRVSAWRFLSPPSALLGAILVDRDGQRIIDESRYGAAIGDALVGRPGWLLIDHALRAEATAQLKTQTVWFQRWQTRYLLHTASTADTIAEAARKAGIDPAALEATVAAYHADAPDPTGKPDEFRRRLTTPPYALLDVSIRPSIAYPCPMLTLGGLAVDEDTGQVRRPDGSTIGGLYAAGRTAVGICSNGYVSGLSLADCVFSGRRAGLAASAVRQEGDSHAQLG